MNYKLILFFLILVLSLYYKKERFHINTNGINSFDKILYINLENRKDRKKQIIAELKKIGVRNNKIKRIDAVNEKYNGHIGCCKSHIKALEYAKGKNYNHVILFEDDLIFTKPKKEVDIIINKFLLDYKENWDVIMLTTAHKNLEKIDNRDYIKNVNSATAPSGYIIQKHFYDKLIEKLKFCLKKMEEEMKKWSKINIGKKKHETSWAFDQCWRDLQKKSRWYIFDPYLGKQGGGAGRSSIMGRIEGFVNFFSTRDTFYKINV
jgi:GR25 family glycosyltransferase involved in LPS biosynthesis